MCGCVCVRVTVCVFVSRKNNESYFLCKLLFPYKLILQIATGWWISKIALYRIVFVSKGWFVYFNRWCQHIYTCRYRWVTVIKEKTKLTLFMWKYQEGGESRLHRRTRQKLTKNANQGAGSESLVPLNFFGEIDLLTFLLRLSQQRVLIHTVSAP